MHWEEGKGDNLASEGVIYKPCSSKRIQTFNLQITAPLLKIEFWLYFAVYYLPTSA